MLPECNYPCLKMDEKPRIPVQFIRESILLTLYQANTTGMILISNINITKKYTQNSKQLTRNNVSTSSITLLQVGVTMLEPFPPSHNAVTIMEKCKSKLQTRQNKLLHYCTALSTCGSSGSMTSTS